jgi:hypothetical protein
VGFQFPAGQDQWFDLARDPGLRMPVPVRLLGTARRVGGSARPRLLSAEGWPRPDLKKKKKKCCRSSHFPSQTCRAG